MAVWYLDNDDEITDAVARLRGTDDDWAVLVVPPGSRIATGRINFKLLAREAESRELAMAVASPDEQVRAMAASAGVLARVTPDEAEAALERGDEPTPVSEPAPATAVAAAPSVGEASGASLLTWRSQRLRLGTLLVLTAVIVAGVLVTTILPTAEITLRPHVTVLGPLEVLVTASPETVATDPEAGAITATVLPIPLSAEITWQAGGEQVTETKATGSVVFSSPSQDSDQEIGEGTRVETPAGTAFRTTQPVVLRRSENGVPAEVVAPVEAVAGGEAGNVRAGRITVAPTLEEQGISVTNPEDTAGGRSETAPLVQSADYEDAVENLENLLRGKLKAYVDDPVNAPDGMTVFAETRDLGPLTLEPTREAIVGTSAAEFTLAGSAEAEVLAVDETEVDVVARARLEAALPEGVEVVAGSLEVGHADGLVDGGRITFEGLASARVTPFIDAEALLAALAGLPVSDAQAILDGLGTATVNVWPGFLGDLPNDRERITLDVLEASATE